MTRPLIEITVDQKLHSLSRGILSFIGNAASIALLLWITELLGGDSPNKDVTWYASVGIRVVSLLALVVLSFMATYRSQGDGPDGGSRPTFRHVKMRVAAAACGAVFFADIAASVFANRENGTISIIQAACLLLFVLAALVAISSGRAVLRLWNEVGDPAKVPVWHEPTELAVNQQVSGIGAHTIFTGVFIAGWLLSDKLPLPVTWPGAIQLMLVLETTILAAICAVHFLRRELVLLDAFTPERSRRTALIIAAAGLFLSLETGIRTGLAFDHITPIGFWLGISTCALGLFAAGYSVVRRD